MEIDLHRLAPLFCGVCIGLVVHPSEQLVQACEQCGFCAVMQHEQIASSQSTSSVCHLTTDRSLSNVFHPDDLRLFLRTGFQEWQSCFDRSTSRAYTFVAVASNGDDMPEAKLPNRQGSTPSSVPDSIQDLFSCSSNHQHPPIHSSSDPLSSFLPTPNQPISHSRMIRRRSEDWSLFNLDF